MTLSQGSLRCDACGHDVNLPRLAWGNRGLAHLVIAEMWTIDGLRDLCDACSVTLTSAVVAG